MVEETKMKMRSLFKMPGWSYRYSEADCSIYLPLLTLKLTVTRNRQVQEKKKNRVLGEIDLLNTMVSQGYIHQLKSLKFFLFHVILSTCPTNNRSSVHLQVFPPLSASRQSNDNTKSTSYTPIVK